jgi:hypothetical protein
MKLAGMVIGAAVLGIVLGLGVTMTQERNRGNYFEEFFSMPERPEDRGVATKIEIVKGTQEPKVEIVGGSDHDFGTMELHGTKRHTFVLKNVGDAHLHDARPVSVHLPRCRTRTPNLANRSKSRWNGKGA